MSPGFAGAAPLVRSTALLIRLRLRRLFNQFTSGNLNKKLGGKARTGNPGKKSSKVIFYFIWPLMLFGFGSLAYRAIINLHDSLDPGGFWLTVEFSAALVAGIAFLLAVLWLASLLLTIASGELAKPDWDLEWLVTLPIRSDTLLWARILERSIVNPSGILALYPVCTVIAWSSGFRWTALLVGALATWPLLLLAALGRTLIDTGLRLSMPAARLRNLHAIVSVLAIATMYLAMSTGMKGKSGFMLDLAASMPDWLAWTPMGLAVRAMNERSFVDAALLALALVAEVVGIVWLGVQLLRFQLRNGVIAGGSRDTGRGAPVRAPAAAQPRGTARAFNTLSAVQRRELTLLSRDRNFLVQSLFIPLLIVGGQLLLGTSGVATSMWHNPNVLASVGFGLAAYSLSMSAFQTLNSEGQALWLLYTFPCSIEDVLKDKAKLWGVVTLAYPLVLFTIGFAVMPGVGWEFTGAILTAFLGIPIYAFIAVALGVFGSNPLEQQSNQRVKPAYVYLYMSLAGLYIYALMTEHPYQRLIFMVLSLLLAFALWQKARDQLPYLLDPDASPPARVSTSDGLIAAMIFFIAQAIVGSIAGRMTGASVLIAFAIAGALTYGLMRWVYASAKTQGVPPILGSTNRPLLGIVAGLGAGTVAAIYLVALQDTEFLSDAKRESAGFEQLGLWVLPLAIIAAPIFEEFIFRGLIFGGLRRSFGVWPAALASAAIFAFLHPPAATVPVFALGVCAALVYERSRSLLAPMLTHAVYNACVIAAQAYLH